MSFRVAVLGETVADVVEGLAWLRRDGAEVTVTLAPQELTAGRWIARAKPKAPTAKGEGRVERLG